MLNEKERLDKIMESFLIESKVDYVGPWKIRKMNGDNLSGTTPTRVQKHAADTATNPRFLLNPNVNDINE